MALALGLALGLGLTASRPSGLLVGTGVGAFVLIMVALTGRPRLIPWAQALLAAEYVGWLELGGGPIEPHALLMAAAVLGVGELVTWSLDARRRAELPVHAARGLGLGLLLLVGAGLAALPLVAAGVRSGGLLPVVMASAATLAITTWAAVLAWRHRVGGG